VRHHLLTIAAILTVLAAVPAHAQVIPGPENGKELYIRNQNGRIVERLRPNGHRYDVFEYAGRLAPIGTAELFGPRMVIYDLNHNVVATLRAELLPPNSDLSVITVVRDRAGHPIGLLERY
jgi:hypothetical protein